MKILFVLWSGDLGRGGGSAVAAKNLIESLLRYKDIDIHVVYGVGTEGSLIEWLAERKVPFTSVSGVGFFVWPKCRGLKDCIKYPIILIRVLVNYIMSVHETKRIIKRVKPDIVHVNNSVLYFGIKAADKMNVPSVWHIREYADFNFNLIPTKYSFMKRVQAHNTISITADISRHFRCTDFRRHFVVYDGVMSKRDVAYIEQKEDYFLFTGAVTHNKGLTDLINAFVLYAENNSNGELWIAGRCNNEAYYNKLKTLLHAKKLNERVKFLGFRSDRYQLMQRARACIVPSLFEGFGFITVEAMMNGSLVIGRNSSGTQMIMEATHNEEFLFDSYEELALKMQQIMEKPSSAFTAHIKKVQTLAAEQFSVERYGDDIYEIYTKILKR